jgi:DNA-directed RNA polymerase subunit F
MAALGETIQEMGESFSQQAATYELGQAFENLDPQAAAEALDELANLSDELSPQTSQALADAMQQASQEIATQSSSEMNQQLSQDLGDAAQALGEQAVAQSKDGGESGAQPAGSADELAQAAQASIQKLAQDMRNINQMMQMTQGVGGMEAGLGSDTGSEGSAEPVERLQGQGNQQLELPTSASKPGGILSPNPPAGMGSTSVGGSLMPGSGGSSDIINSIIIPYTYPWFWRNVVATYFQSD